MALWTMARPNQKEKRAAEDAEKPLPDPNEQRPGTSGTEMMLTTNRQRASEKYQRARRDERSYRTKKRSTSARADSAEARKHFREAAHHLRLGFRSGFSAVKNIPYLGSEKADGLRARMDESKRKKAVEKRKKLEEALAKDKTADADSHSGDDEAGPA